MDAREKIIERIERQISGYLEGGPGSPTFEQLKSYIDREVPEEIDNMIAFLDILQELYDRAPTDGGRILGDAKKKIFNTLRRSGQPSVQDAIRKHFILTNGW